ncbi:thiamine pyrophosphate-binding protein [Nakamurella lactea]|uniref:thiamine pyrophosphate-binding protein n=1 Tax=Nakamurella lactea TaxID=459515 RepID=UPI000408A462|nr:thiamine pyrophosphate-binding protein [Nakamurella lactea]
MNGTGGDAVVAALRALQVDVVFGVASIHNLPILDAIARGGEIRVINVRHEQAAVHAADGFSRVTGRLGVAITSTGPGAANSMGGLFEAGFASSRVLMLTGQVESRFYGQGKAFLHEAEHQLPMLATITRQAWSVRRGADIIETVVAAGRAAQAGRPAPTAVEIPVDLQYAVAERLVAECPPIVATTPDPERVQAAADLLSVAQRPLIWAGGGVNHAGAAAVLRKFAERWSIPVVTSTAGRGSLPEDHPLCLGSLITDEPLREVVASADVVLAVGTHFQMYTTGFWQLPLTDRLIHLDADPTVIGRTYPAEVSLVADARLGLAAIADTVAETRAEPGWLTLAQKAAHAARDSALERLGPDHRGILDSVRRHLPRDGVVVRDATVPAYAWGDRLLPIYVDRTSLNPVSAAIGPGLPLAVGAAVGTGRRTFVMHGDGGIMLSIGELATIAQFDLPITVCVFNDRGYGILRGIQSATFGGAQNDVDLATPDFTMLGTAMGLPSRYVDSVETFDAAFAESVHQPGPMLIEIDLTKLQPMDYPIGAQELLS